MSPPSTSENKSLRPTFLTGKRQIHKIIENNKLSEDTYEIVCELEHRDQCFGLPVPQSVKLAITEEDDHKYYTPISRDCERGRVRYIIKAYAASEEFPEAGKFSRALVQLKPGHELFVEGPFGNLLYSSGVIFEELGKTPKCTKVRNVVLIGAGSGITPLFKLAQEIRDDPEAAKKGVKISMIYGNKSEEDILIKDEIDALAAEYPDFKVHYMVDSHPNPEKFEGSIGYITEKTLDDNCVIDYNGAAGADANTLIFQVGPKPMGDGVKRILEKRNYKGLMWGFF